MTAEALSALFWVCVGAYGLGVVAILWACTSEPWPDRAFIALGWPVAVVLIWWKDG